MAKSKSCELAGASCVRFAPDGALLVGAEAGLFRVDPSTRKPKQLIATDGDAGPIALSADGKMIFVGESKRVLVAKLAKQPRVSAKLASSGDGVMSIAPSPDGRLVLVVGNDEGGTLKCFELGKPRAKYTIGSVRYAQTAWLPGGSRFLTASLDWSAAVRVHDATKGTVVIDLGDPHPERADAGQNPGPSINAVAVEPSSGDALLGSDQGVMRLALAAGAEPTWLLRDHEVHALAVGPTRLVAGCSNGKLRTIELRTGKVVATIQAEAGVVSVDVSADGKRLAFVTDGSVTWS